MIENRSIRIVRVGDAERTPAAIIRWQGRGPDHELAAIQQVREGRTFWTTVTGWPIDPLLEPALDDALEQARSPLTEVARVSGFGSVLADESADGFAGAIIRLVEHANQAGHEAAIAQVLGAIALVERGHLAQLREDVADMGITDATRRALEAAHSRATALIAQAEGCTPDCAEFGHSAYWHAPVETWAERADRTDSAV